MLFISDLFHKKTLEKTQEKILVTKKNYRTANKEYQAAESYLIQK